MQVRYLLAGASSLLLSGCGMWNSIFYTFDPNDGTSISVDVKQRVVLAAKVVDSETTGQGDTRKVVERRRTMVCAEPSPDALSVYASSLSGSAQTGGSKALDLALASTESGSFVGLRTQTIQLLRDAMYRLCEGHLSGGLAPPEFARLQSRYQQVMMGLLAIEQLTGVVTPRPTAITAGSANALNAHRVHANAEKNLAEANVALKDATKEVADAKTAVADQEKKVADTTDATQKAVEQATLDALKKELAGKEKVAAAAAELQKLRLATYQQLGSGLSAAVSAGADISGPAQPHARMDAATTEKVAKAVVEIVDKVIIAGFANEGCLALFAAMVSGSGSSSPEAIKTLNACRPTLEKSGVSDAAINQLELKIQKAIQPQR